MKPLPPISQVKNAASRYMRVAPFLMPSVKRVAYLGPGISSNMGDWAMFLAHRMSLPQWTIQPVPVRSAPRPVVLAGKVWGLRSVRGICLGGGTLVGTTTYRHSLQLFADAFPLAPLFTLGVGVEDPNFVGRRSLTTIHELRQWAHMLRRFPAVNVRGPDSARILADVGVEAKVTGDPALLLGDLIPLPHEPSGLIALNFGITTELWGSNPALLMEKITALGRQIVRTGKKIRLIPVWPRDLPKVHELAARISHGVEIRNHIGDLRGLLSSIRECDLLIGMKLHSVVFAASVFVPAIAIEYRPKCADFQRSIGQTDYIVRTDSFDLVTVSDMADQILSDRIAAVDQLALGVRGRRDALRLAIRESEDKVLAASG